jgi:hypothetical protein
MNYELEDTEKKIKISNLSEVYYQLLMNESLKIDIDSEIMESRILSMRDFKAKDIFDILTVTENKRVIDHLVPIIKQTLINFIPEEIIILNKLIEKRGLKDELTSSIENYLEANIDDLEYLECARVYHSCLSTLSLSDSFK